MIVTQNTKVKKQNKTKRNIKNDHYSPVYT